MMLFIKMILMFLIGHLSSLHLLKVVLLLSIIQLMGHEYTMRYYLADEIYPNWSTFVKTIPRPLGAKRKYFASKQESARKDVERVFGVLQSRFAIVRGPVQY